MHRLTRALLAGALLFLHACSPIGNTPPPASEAVTVEPGPPANPTATANPASSTSLRVWLPPEFAPEGETEAALLLTDRLLAFEASHPRLALQVRIKAESGPSGLIESLRAASAAAPGSMPDIIAVDPIALHTAALKGLILPFPDEVEPPTEEAWFPYAVEASRIDGVFFGLPFASDALILAYRASAFETVPSSWTSMIGSDRPVLLPAADPTAQFTLAQYLALGGTLFGSNGRPALDPAVLSIVLDFYASAREAGVLIASANRTETVADSWAGLRDGRVDAAASTYHTYAMDDSVRFAAGAPLPTRDGQGISFARTWCWALVTADPDKQAAALDLIRWLSEPEFVGGWTEALALLPPSPAALEGWSDGARATLAALLVNSLRPQPSEEIIATFGPPLLAAVESVLAGAATPDAAAFEAAQTVQSP